MAYSAGTISAAEIADQAAGKPCFMGRNILDLSTYTPEWSTADNWTGSTDSVNPDYPTSRLSDRYCDLDTRPTGTASSWHLLFQFDDSDANAVIDTLLLQASIGDCISAGTVELIVTIADDADFTSNAVDIIESGDVTFTPGAAGNRRVRWIDFGGASARYSSVKFLRVSFIGSGTGNWIPQVSELWVGRRRQLHRFPNDPHDPAELVSVVDDQTTEVGGTMRYVIGGPRILMSGTWDLTTDEDDITTIAALRTDTNNLTKLFAYWLGTDDVRSFAWMLAEPKYSRPFRSGTHRTFALSAEEQTPFLYPELEAAS